VARLGRLCPKVERGEMGKGKEGVDVMAGREGIRSLVSCAGGREGVVDFSVDATR
jgi:hypothetical protein